MPVMRILVFQHSKLDTPGRLGATLRDHGFKLDIRRVNLPPENGGAPVPTDLDNVGGVISLGGPFYTRDIDNTPWMQAEADFIKRAHDAQLPVVGICLGAQLIAHALGGKVEAMERPELGFHPVSILVPGQTDTMLAGIPWNSPQFHVHSDHVTEPPSGATVLAKSDACPIQAFKAGLRTYAFQYHFETDRPGITAFAKTNAGQFASVGLSPEVVERQAEEHYPMFARIGDRLSLNLATYSFPFERLLAV